MFLEYQLGGPEGADKHQRAAAATPPRQVAEQLDRGVIAPLQILQHQQQRLFGAGPIDQLAELAQHAVLSRTGGLALQLPSVLVADEPGQLQEPGGRYPAHQYECRRTAVRAAQ
ncbi:hypothetical protein PEC18_31275 [Paucibacter sp. O1-1]|nr:hypothetical protein [Paucibacter sp. O1-1]MDA3830187.1 hypothetical protein [Paucibacter sp. O1-1]